MKTKIKFFLVALVVLAVAGITLYMVTGTPSRQEFEGRVSEEVEKAFGKPLASPDPEEKYTNEDGTINRKAAAGHLEMEIANVEK